MKIGTILQGECKKMAACFFFELKNGYVDQFRNISQRNESLLQLMN